MRSRSRFLPEVERRRPGGFASDAGSRRDVGGDACRPGGAVCFGAGRDHRRVPHARSRPIRARRSEGDRWNLVRLGPSSWRPRLTPTARCSTGPSITIATRGSSRSTASWCAACTSTWTPRTPAGRTVRDQRSAAASASRRRADNVASSASVRPGTFVNSFLNAGPAITNIRIGSSAVTVALRVWLSNSAISPNT